MTAAIDAVYFQLNRHLMDLKAREKIQKNSVLRANKRLGCSCLPSSDWTFEPMGLREVHTFITEPEHDPGNDPGNDSATLRPSGLRYLGALQQSRIFAHLEVFELHFPQELGSTESTVSKLPELERQHGPNVKALVVSSTDLWDIRNQSVLAFLDAARRAVDIIRLSVLSTETENTSNPTLWEPQGMRAFHASPGFWISSTVYEANSAQLDKACRWLGRTNRA